jgi:hypothetical protein
MIALLAAGIIAASPVVIDNHALAERPAMRDVTISAGISVGGGPLTYGQVDTGSVGVMISRDVAGPYVTLTGESGGREFSSSGRIYQGVYAKASVSLRDHSGGVARTVPIRVLVVDRILCDPQYASCKDKTVRPVGWAFIGVGFDRAPFIRPDQMVRDTQTPSDNPFLQLEPMVSGALPRRYIFTRDHIELGPTDERVATFTSVLLPGPSGLADATGPKDWKRPLVTYVLRLPVSDATAYTPPVGALPMLMDTGLTRTILTVPRDARPTGFGSAEDPERFEARAQVAIATFPDPALRYTITTPACGEPSPDPRMTACVSWGRNGDTYALNTGSDFLNAFDYLYDSDNGRVGFRPR